MKRRAFLSAIGSATLLPFSPRSLWPSKSFRRSHPSDATWPSQQDWKRLNDAVEGNLITVNFPLSRLKADPGSVAAKRLAKDLRNPFYIGDQPGLTQTLGWVDAWATQPSVYAVAARNVQDIAAAVNFAREHNLRLVVKGGGHSYQGTSNAPDSLLIWTRHMRDIALHVGFVPGGCEHSMQPQPAVTLGAGTIWMQAYQAVTTQSAKYVQGGGCTTVGVAGLIQSGGFGSFSKHYGLAAGSLLEAEIVTADGKIRVANASTNPDLFWALKGGGGGSFGVVSRVTVRLHELPQFFGVTNFTIKAASDDAYRGLIREFVSFYREHLFNDHWGEQVGLNPDNSLEIKMLFQGLDAEQAKKVWQPFLAWVARSPKLYSVGRVVVGSLPAQRMWDMQWLKEHWPEIAIPDTNALIGLFDYALAHVFQPIFEIDDRPEAGPNNTWWKGDAGQVGWFIWGYESLWLPASLLESDSQQRVADALFSSSRYSRVGLHFNKGLAGAPQEAIAAAKDTAMNPAVADAFALVISDANGQPTYPGVPGHEPDVADAQAKAAAVNASMDQIRKLLPRIGSYVWETAFFQPNWQDAFWGENYARLRAVKDKYDPEGLFFLHHGVGSEGWSADGFTRVK